METITCIRLRSLGIGYRAKGNDRLVADGINADILEGELTCLLGRNGIGKSTLLRTLCGFQPQLHGTVEFKRTTDNKPLSRTPSNSPCLGGEQSPSPKQGRSGGVLSKLISVVLTEKPDVRNMTARELVELGRSPHTGFWGILTDEDRAAVDEALGLVGIMSLADRKVHTLSDGERQKVMIAKALAQQTPVILLDEPTAFLDFPGKVDVMQLLHRLAHEQHKIILLSTHDIELALQMADRIWLMEPPLQLPRGGEQKTLSNSPCLGGEQGTSPRQGRSGGVSVIHIGTPRGLAADGTLSRLIAHEGVVFDTERLTINVQTPPDLPCLGEVPCSPPKQGELEGGREGSQSNYNR